MFSHAGKLQAGKMVVVEHRVMRDTDVGNNKDGVMTVSQTELVLGKQRQMMRSKTEFCDDTLGHVQARYSHSIDPHLATYSSFGLCRPGAQFLYIE